MHNPFLRARAARDRENGLEKVLRLAFERAGVQYEAQKRFGRYRVDFYLPAYSAVVEADGERFHPTSEQATRSAWSAERVQKARIRDEHLAARGLRVIHLRGNAITRNPDGVVAAVLRQLGS